MFFLVVAKLVLPLVIFTPVIFVAAKLLPTFSNDPHTKFGSKQTWLTSAYIVGTSGIINVVIMYSPVAQYYQYISFVAYIVCIKVFWKASFLGAFLFAIGVSLISILIGSIVTTMALSIAGLFG
jgi:hypothetical protein